MISNDRNKSQSLDTDITVEFEVRLIFVLTIDTDRYIHNKDNTIPPQDTYIIYLIGGALLRC